MDASVVIPTHNRRQAVLRAAGALLRQEYPPDSFEIIVSCDRCTDGTEESLRAAFDGRVQVVRADIAGQAGALNAGLKHARGWLAIMLDDEMEPEKGLVAAHLQAHRSEPAAKLAVTGYSPVVLDADSTPYQRMMAQDYENYFDGLARPSDKSTPADLCGCNFSLPLSAFGEVHGFNESYFFQRNDFELAIRLLRAGYEIGFCRAACARQHLAVTADTIIARTAERASNDYRLAREYPWCVPYLPFYRVLANPPVRRRWRVLWETSGPLGDVFGAARRIFPENVRLANLEYAARYCAGLRREIGSWYNFTCLLGQHSEGLTC